MREYICKKDRDQETRFWSERTHRVWMAGDAAKKILAQNTGYLRNARMLILGFNVRAGPILMHLHEHKSTSKKNIGETVCCPLLHRPPTRHFASGTYGIASLAGT